MNFLMHFDGRFNGNQKKNWVMFCCIWYFMQNWIRKKQLFDIADVINSLNEKLIFRHPHIYGNVEVKDEEEVKTKLGKTKTERREQICTFWCF